MAELIDVGATDKFMTFLWYWWFFDCCFTRMINQVGNNKRALDKIKLEKLIGTDVDSKISALAVAK